MKRLIILLVFAAVLWPKIVGCTTEKDINGNKEDPARDEAAIGEEVALPGPDLEGEISLEEAVYSRISRRSFGGGGLTLTQVGQLLWASAGLGVDGVTGASRTIPSAGATYPLEAYLVTGEVENLPAGIYHYDYRTHSLEALQKGDVRSELAGAALGQDIIAQAPASIVIFAHYDRTTQRYGDRGMRYVYMDAGYASQNIYLQAESLKLATVAVGAFDDEDIKEIMTVEGNPLMIMPVGPRP